MAWLTISLPSDRNYGGSCYLRKAPSKEGEPIQTEFLTNSIFGISGLNIAVKRGNPLRNSLYPYGNTPTGFYRPSIVTYKKNLGEDKLDKWRLALGKEPYILLDPVAGEAALAASNGRDAFLIHAISDLYKDNARTMVGCGSLVMYDKPYRNKLLKPIFEHINKGGILTGVEIINSNKPLNREARKKPPFLEKSWTYFDVGDPLLIPDLEEYQDYLIKTN